MYYPWQTEQWQQLMAARLADRLPHALLLTGIPGTGKAMFADSFIRTMLCEKTRNDPPVYCKTCHSCRLMAGCVHPNVNLLVPEKTGAAIKVDQIRLVSEFVSQSSFNGEFRFVVINPAEAMNINAANALLKTLEEPAKGAMLLLISSESQRLPATILSRCQRLVFPQPEKKLALAWMQEQAEIENPDLLLRLANGAPLAALALAQDERLAQRNDVFQALMSNHGPIHAASACADLENIYFLDTLLSFVMDIVRLQVGLAEDALTNSDYKNQLVAMKSKMPLLACNQFLTYLQHLRGQVCSGFNLNKQLMMETVFVRWLDCVEGVR